MTASEAAKLLEISKSMVYALAASGELVSYRYGRIIRLDRADVEEYKSKCRSLTTKSVNAGAIVCAARLPGEESALAKFFRQAGAAPKPKHTTTGKRRESSQSAPGSTEPSRLRLVTQ